MALSYVNLVGTIQRSSLKGTTHYNHPVDCPADAQFVLQVLPNGHVVDHATEFNPFYKIKDGVLWYFYIYGWGVSGMKYKEDFLRDNKFLEII